MLKTDYTACSALLDQSRLQLALSEHLRTIGDRTLIIVCIGTDRSTGDSFGPFTGSLLHSLIPYPYIYGTLPQPIHRQNYLEQTSRISRHAPNRYTIAIDASLGDSSDIGHIRIRSGSIRPAAAFGGSLPPIGDLAITGIVGASGLHDYQTLQSTRLSLVVSMASDLAGALAQAIRTSPIAKDIG